MSWFTFGHNLMCESIQVPLILRNRKVSFSSTKSAKYQN